MKIDDRQIGPGQPPYIVAEIGCNHGGSFERAIELLTAAKEAGADAAKWQCFTPDGLTLDSDRPEFIVKNGPWKGRRLYDLAQETCTPLPWFPELFEHARQIGITTFASVFAPADVDFLEQLGCPAYKIASFELVDLPLIRYAALTGKPIILSTGMASAVEINEACDAAYAAEPDIVLLHCVSGYPTPDAEANLYRFATARFPGFDGISDHTTGPEIPIAATALGATIIEKHFRLGGFPKTEDTPFSMSAGPFAKMVTAVRNTWAALQPSTPMSEAPSRPLRRSLFAVTDIPAGTHFAAENVRSIRPGDGLPPKELDSLIGRTASRDISRGEPMARDMVR